MAMVVALTSLRVKPSFFLVDDHPLVLSMQYEQTFAECAIGSF